MFNMNNNGVKLSQSKYYNFFSALWLLTYISMTLKNHLIFFDEFIDWKNCLPEMKRKKKSISQNIRNF